MSAPTAHPQAQPHHTTMATHQSNASTVSLRSESGDSAGSRGSTVGEDDTMSHGFLSAYGAEPEKNTDAHSIWMMHQLLPFARDAWFQRLNTKAPLLTTRIPAHEGGPPSDLTEGKIQGMINSAIENLQLAIGCVNNRMPLQEATLSRNPYALAYTLISIHLLAKKHVEEDKDSELSLIVLNMVGLYRTLGVEPDLHSTRPTTPMPRTTPATGEDRDNVDDEKLDALDELWCVIASLEFQDVAPCMMLGPGEPRTSYEKVLEDVKWQMKGFFDFDGDDFDYDGDVPVDANDSAGLTPKASLSLTGGGLTPCPPPAFDVPGPLISLRANKDAYKSWKTNLFWETALTKLMSEGPKETLTTRFGEHMTKLMQQNVMPKNRRLRGGVQVPA